MDKGFWGKLKKPRLRQGFGGQAIMALAPMANVTDAAFRRIIAQYGKPDVFWTEFVSADGLASAGQEKLMVDFWFDQKQRPIVAQIFGSRPENILKAAKLVRQLKFDGLDINMGCPDRAVLKQGAGGALIKDQKLASEIIDAAKEGAKNLPVSVKTRLGTNKMMWEDWLPFLADQELAAIIVHLRTVKEMSEVDAHWELLPKIVKLIKRKDGPLILANGDVKSLEEARQKAKESDVDGIMIGRGIFGNPWLFAGETPSLEEKLSVMVEHSLLFEKMFDGIKNFDIMKKHFKAYVNGFAGAKELRVELMNAKNANEVLTIVRQHYPKIEMPDVFV